VGGLAAGISAILVMLIIRPVREDVRALVGLARRALRRSSPPSDRPGHGGAVAGNAVITVDAVVAGDGAEG